MIATTHLLLIATTITAVWLLGHYLQKLPPIDQDTNKSPVSILGLIHVLGANPKQIENLKALMLAQDRTSLTEFLLFNRARVLEIENYVATVMQKRLREYAMAVAKGKIDTHCKPFLPDQPPNFDFSVLNVKEIQSLCEFYALRNHPINIAVFNVFGGIHRFMENYRFYRELYTGAANTVEIPASDYRRPELEWLAKNNIVVKGQRIPLKDRLRILGLPQLKKMAEELKIRGNFDTKEHVLEALANVPGAAILLAMKYSIDDLFFINPNRVDVATIDRMISAYNIYARLLCDATSKSQQKVALKTA